MSRSCINLIWKPKDSERRVKQQLWNKRTLAMVMSIEQCVCLGTQ